MPLMRNVFRPCLKLKYFGAEFQQLRLVYQANHTTHVTKVNVIFYYYPKELMSVNNCDKNCKALVKDHLMVSKNVGRLGDKDFTVNFRPQINNDLLNIGTLGGLTMPFQKSIACVLKQKESLLPDRNFVLKGEDWSSGCESSLMFRKSDSKTSSASKNGKQQSVNKPTNDQLQIVKENLVTNLTRIFYDKMNSDIYSDGIVFDNKFKNTRIVGKQVYFQQIFLFRILVRMKLKSPTFNILKVTSHPEDSSIRIRWQIKGINWFNFSDWWQSTKFNDKKSEENWLDGFSLYYVNKDCKIVYHLADKMIPDDSPVISSVRSKHSLLQGSV